MATVSVVVTFVLEVGLMMYAGIPKLSLMVSCFPHVLSTILISIVEEYQEFYKVTFKDTNNPLAWHHFSGDSGSGVSFKAIIFFPFELSEEYWQQGMSSATKGIRLMVKRVFITDDLGEDALPKWASWVKVVVDGEHCSFPFP